MEVAGSCSSVNMTLILCRALEEKCDDVAELTTTINIGNTQYSFVKERKLLYFKKTYSTNLGPRECRLK